MPSSLILSDSINITKHLLLDIQVYLLFKFPISFQYPKISKTSAFFDNLPTVPSQVPCPTRKDFMRTHAFEVQFCYFKTAKVNDSCFARKCHPHCVQINKTLEEAKRDSVFQLRLSVT